MLSKPKVLILTDWFEPGYLAGGPIRSVSNLLKLCSDQVEFSVLTSDRDFQIKTSYPGITPNVWIQRDGYKVMYSSHDQRRKIVKDILETGNFDKYYLNSFFSKDFTIRPLLRLRRIGKLRAVILAPRGMLGEGALSLKTGKKKAFIMLFRLLGIHKKLTFHSTAASESASVQNVFRNIQLAEIGNVPEIPGDNYSRYPNAQKRFVFVSRMSPKKNLDFLLQTWQRAGLKDSVLNAYGTREDSAYYQKCKRIIEGSENVTLKDAISPEEVKRLLTKSDYFVLPTLNENFGHAIIEALAGGCPVIISDQTPWNDLEKYGAGWVIPLDDEEKWERTLRSASNLDDESYKVMSRRAQEYVKQKFDFDDLRKQYLKLFQTGD